MAYFRQKWIGLHQTILALLQWSCVILYSSHYGQYNILCRPIARLLVTYSSIGTLWNGAQMRASLFRRHRISDFAFRYGKLSVCLSICPWRWGTVSWSHRLEFFGWGVRSLQTQTSRTYSKGNTPKFWSKACPKWPTPVDLSVVEIRWQIAGGLSEIVQWSQWGAYRKPPSLFE